MRPSFLLLLAVQAAAIAVVLASSGALPERMAVHFIGDGSANGWGRRWDYLAGICLVIAVVPLLVALPALLLRVLPPARINLPHRAYWLAPERQAATVAWLSRQAWLAGVPVAAGLLVLHLAVVQANAQAPPHLAPAMVMAVIAVIAGGELALLLRLWLRFHAPPP